MDTFDTVELSKELIDDLRVLADNKNMDIDDYVMNILEEDVLRKITICLASE